MTFEQASAKVFDVHGPLLAALSPKVRPAPIIALDAGTRVTHTAPGFEDYFGETAECVEVDTAHDCALLWGDWT